MNNIIALKLVNGEEIIGRIDDNNLRYLSSMLNNIKDDEKYFIKIEKVRRIEIGGDGSGRIGLTLVPFMFTNMDGTISIQISTICSVNTDISKQLQDAFLEHTSGLSLSTHM
jgi:hypothetical protein